MEMMETCESSLKSGTMEQFPFKYPKIFTSVLLHCGTRDIHTIRSVCPSWRQWVTVSTTLWRKMLQQAVRRQKINLDALPPLGQGLLNREEVASYRMEQLLFLAEPLLASLPNSSQSQQQKDQNQSQQHKDHITCASENEANAHSLALRIERAALEESVTANRQTMYLVRRLEGTVGRILGPPNIFLRLKVNHPVVSQIVQEVLGRHLGSILYDKRDRENEELRKAVQRSMFRGQNWAQVEFSPTEADKPKWNARGAKVLDGGAEALEEALRLSLQPEGQDGEANAEEREEEGGKRKLKDEGEGPPSKKRKSNEEGEEGEAGEEEEDVGLQDIYASVRPPVKHNQFPSILELLDIDIPVVEALVKDRSSVESTIIVPDFDSFLHYPSLMTEKEMTLVGKDGDGKVATVRPSSFSSGNADNIVVGAIENPLTIGPPQEVGVWAGQDIRSRWPEFEEQLARLDAAKKAEEERRKAKEEEEARNKEKKEKEVPEVKEVLALGVGTEGAVLAQGSAVLAEPLPSTSASTSSGNTAKGGSSGSLMDQLAARGIVVIQKEVEKDCNNTGQVKVGESQDDEESTDDEEEGEEEEDSGEEDDLEEEEEEGDDEDGGEGEEEEEDYDEEALLIPG